LKELTTDKLTNQQSGAGSIKRNALYSVTARVPRFDLCLTPADVDDDVVRIDTILEALEPGYPPPEIDERRRSRADVKYYESASTTEGSDDREHKQRKRLKKNEYSRIYRARKMKQLKTLSGNQPLAPTHKKSQSLVCPHCGFIGKRAAGFANHLRACCRRHGDEPPPPPSPDEAASEEDERREQERRDTTRTKQEQQEQQEQISNTIDILEDTWRLPGNRLTLSLPIIVPSIESPNTESPEYC
jgi:hypothetical protein